LWHRRFALFFGVDTMRAAGIAALLALSAAGVALARPALEPEALAAGRVRDPAWLPNGKLLRLASFGQRLLLADLYWLKTVMYMGESTLAPERGLDALYPLGEVVTDLDPRHGYAYQVVGSNLSGLARRVSESDRILEKGIRNVPDRWALPFLLAFNKFFYENDFAGAAAWARRAAEVGRRPQLALLAANLSLAANTEDQYQTAISFLELSLPQAEAPEFRQQLQQRLVKVRTYQALSRVERAIEVFRARNLRAPLVLEELVWNGFLPRIPADPSGGAIEYDPWTGTVWSSAIGPRNPLRVTR
jgi:tetratricopeptide (TPR) repeat protein